MDDTEYSSVTERFEEDISTAVARMKLVVALEKHKLLRAKYEIRALRNALNTAISHMPSGAPRGDCLAVYHTTTGESPWPSA